MWCSSFVKIYFSFWEIIFFRSTAQIYKFSPWITRVVWPHVTYLLGRYFCLHNPLFYHLNLIPCHYWSWQRNIYFLVNIFVRHTFSMSKSSIETKTVLTMTDITECTELLAFKRQKDCCKVAVKVSLCICVVLSWDYLSWCIYGNNLRAVSVWGKRLHTKTSLPVGKRYLSWVKGPV